MKLIMRADDLGISEGVNCGICKAIKDGVITSVGLMPNMEHALDGYEMIKDCNVSVGQHTNICLGKPLCSPEEIPSLVDENGEFYSSKVINKSSSFANGWSLFAYLLCLELIASRYRTFFGDKTAISINFNTLSYLSFGSFMMNQNRFSQSWRRSLS